MTERTILVLAALAAMTAILIAVDALLAIFFDEQGRKGRRAIRREPWGETR